MPSAVPVMFCISVCAASVSSASAALSWVAASVDPSCRACVLRASARLEWSSAPREESEEATVATDCMGARERWVSGWC